jgi:hypothetical protein
MNHPIYHGWQCRCGIRNAPELPACHGCGAPASAGQPVYLAGPPVQQQGPPPVKRNSWAWTPKAMTGWGSVGIVLFFMAWATNYITPISWFVLVVGIVFFLAGNIIGTSRR